MKTLFKNAQILTMIDDEIIKADLVVDNNLIAYIGNDSSSFGPFDRIVVYCPQERTSNGAATPKAGRPSGWNITQPMSTICTVPSGKEAQP